MLGEIIIGKIIARNGHEEVVDFNVDHEALSHILELALALTQQATEVDIKIGDVTMPVAEWMEQPRP